MQLVMDNKRSPLFENMKRMLKTCPVESVISVRGRLVERPLKDQQDGRRYEVVAEKIDILNEAKALPFNPMSEEALPSEEFRLKHRFLDLRRPAMQENLIVRAEMNNFIRQFFRDEGFLEVETPMLFKSTPEGAKEYLVPAGKEHSFALPQSPQQFKQMLMASGVEKYYQIARCFRNEDLRADRQPEFTQLDIEMAFVEGPETVMSVIENFIKAAMKEFTGANITEDFPVFDYDTVMRLYGSDKPDIRYGLEIEAVAEDDTTVLEILRPVNIPESLLPETKFELSEEDNELLKSEKAFYFAFRRPKICTSGATELGKIRNEIIKRIEQSGMERKFRDELVPGKGFLWVRNFPLLAPCKPADESMNGRRFESMHHPFTAPVSEDISLLDADPLQVRGQHYDLVWNGTEIGGGSIRIHSAELQLKLLRNIMGLPESYIAQFSHLISALQSGCPPHGGIAIGLDRFLAMLRGCQSIRM